MRDALRRNPRARRAGLLAATALLFVAALVAVPTPGQAFCQMWTDYYTYYSDATHTEQVGWCEFDCYCVTYCDGTRTSFYDHASWSGCL